MQKPDEQKRADILEVATRLFATRPFHEVRLEDIAAEAKIGKGTIYIYFKNKEDLYAQISRRGFAHLVTGLTQKLAEADLTPPDALRLIVKGLVEFAVQNPLLFHMMRAGQIDPPDENVRRKRVELGGMIETTLRRGIRRGDFADPHPELTAQFIPAAVRGAIVHGPPSISAEVLTNQILRVFGKGVGMEGGR